MIFAPRKGEIHGKPTTQKRKNICKSQRRPRRESLEEYVPLKIRYSQRRRMSEM